MNPLLPRSPYPWRDTLAWPVRWLRPSMRGHRDLEAGAPFISASPAPTLNRHRLDRRRTARRSDVVRLVFVGDLMCMPGDRVPRVDPSLRALIAGSDLLIGNCEAPVTRASCDRRARCFFSFEMAAEFLSGLLEQLGARPGNIVLSVANNHVGDAGRNGLPTTLERLRGLGIIPVGHVSESTPLIRVDVRGLRLGLFAWTDWLNRRLTGELDVWRTETVAAMSRLSWDMLRQRTGADLLIGLPHWGVEFRHYPTPNTRSLARRLVAAGFNLLVGHHPHVLQPLEWFGDALCAYSLGNLLGPPSLLAAWPTKLVSVLEVRITPAGPRCGSAIYYRLHPFVQSGRASDVSLVPLANASAALRWKLERRLEIVCPRLEEASDRRFRPRAHQVGT